MCIASRFKLALPKFVDALLGICVFVQPFSCLHESVCFASKELWQVTDVRFEKVPGVGRIYFL